MDYAITNLNQVADCDFLINMANNEKASLDVKRHVDEYGVTKFTTSSLALETEYQGILIEISATEQILQTLPAGTARVEQERKLYKLNYRKFVLETRKESYGAIALLEKQMDFAMVQKQIDEIDTFIAAVKDRKDALQA